MSWVLQGGTGLAQLLSHSGRTFGHPKLLFQEWMDVEGGAGSFQQNLLYRAWQIRSEVLQKQDELLKGLVRVVGRQN